jgi:Protein of unknown function (DUF3500)
MNANSQSCPECEVTDRRSFLGAVAAGLTLPLWATPRVMAAPTPQSGAETAVKGLYDSLSEEQRKVICFGWDHVDERFPKLPLRAVVSPNWQITKHKIRSEFFSTKQQHLAHDVFRGLIDPTWHKKFETEIKQDCGGPFGCEHSLAIFGTPGNGPFEMVITGRHMTLRADGNSTDAAAFGGPIFYGHQGEQFNETATHPGNVFWCQAQAANKLYQMLDGKQRTAALIETNRPPENRKTIEYRGSNKLDGLPMSEMSADQQAEMKRVLAVLIEPFRGEDRDEVLDGLKKNGGLDQCALAFYRDGDIGNDEVWDNWKLEGPRFCWWFRGQPHVHVWVNAGGV